MLHEPQTGDRRKDMLRFFVDSRTSGPHFARGVFAVECLRNHYLLFVDRAAAAAALFSFCLPFFLSLFPQVFFRASIQWPS